VQTSAINYRVADFLKQYPPFQYMEVGDLLELAAHGRVKFHEIDEFIIWQDAAHGSYIFVIQQGTVSLWQATPNGEELRDMRGPGDLLGIDRFHDSAASIYSAKSASEVMIYALPADTFARLIDKYPQAKRYIDAHSSATTNYAPVDQRKGHHETLLYESVRRADPPVCTGGNSLRQAARRMQRAGAQAIAVVDGESQIVGVLTSNDILRAVAANEFDPSQTVEDFMDAAPITIPSDATLSQAALALGATGVAAVTQTGTRNGRLLGLITATDIGPAFGDHPSEILLEIPRAPSIEALRRIQQRARTFTLEHLTSPSTVDWLSDFVHRADFAILKQLSSLIPPPEGRFCWCLYGAAGRSESLPPVEQRAVILLGEDANQDHFTGWYRKINAALLACGYLERPAHFDAVFSCASLDEWKRRYHGWIDDPIRNSAHGARHLFDLRPALGDFALCRNLEDALKSDVRDELAFVQILANDCLSSLPPLTFFHDVVIDESGESSQIFEIEKTALRPLVDVGRVFGIAAGRMLGASTQERFRLARTLLPEHESIFREASNTLRVVLHQQARAGIRQQNNGSELQPALLSHYDRQVLKSGFRSILKLLEFTAEGAWMAAA
jgi:CBS domain-containing protein